MFTVLIPIYNHAKYLPDAINSALQDILVTKIIAVDDGSSDDSPDIARGYAMKFPERFELLANPDRRNKGAHARINELVALAETEFVSILNSDDYFVSGRFSAMKSTIDSTGCDIVIGSLLLINGEGEYTGVKIPHVHFEYSPPSHLHRRKFDHEANLREALFSQNVAATTSNYVFRKSLWSRQGGFKSYRYAHDWEFLLQASLSSRVRYNPSALTAYRLHSSNTISEGRTKIVHEVRQLVKNFCLQTPISTADSDRLFRYNRYLTSDEIVTDHSQSLTYRSAKRAGIFEDDKYSSRSVARSSSLPVYIENNVRLAIMMYDVDYVLVLANQTDASAGPQIIRDYPLMFFRPDLLACLFAEDAPPRPLFGIDIVVYDQEVGRLTALNKVLGKSALANHPMKSDRMRLRKSDGSLTEGLIIRKSSKPVIFVLPGFLAIGGVERVLESVMHNLAHQFDFVIINLELLPQSSGSSTNRMLKHASGIYELASYTTEKSLKHALSILRDAYSPEILWICNGCMCHIRNMGAIRAIFKAAKIVDQQCYDDSEGWIQHYHHPNLRQADLYVACNGRIKSKLETKYKIPTNLTRLIYPPFSDSFLENEALLRDAGQNLRTQLGLDDKTIVLGVVARVSDQKQPLLYVELMRELQRRQIKAFLLYVGDGPLLADAELVIEREKIGNIMFTGFIDRPHAAFFAMDCYLILSKYEGLPVAMLEALATGVPVLSTDVGDVRSVLEEIKCGEIITSTGVEAICDDVVRMTSRLPQLRLHLLTQRQKIVERFSAKTISSAYEAAFSV